MGEFKKKVGDTKLGNNNTNLHDYIKSIFPSLKEPPLIEYSDFCSTAKAIFSHTKENNCITCMVFNLYHEKGEFNNKQLFCMANLLKNIIGENDIISVDYDKSAIFLLLPDAGWSGGVIPIAQKISDIYKNDFPNIEVDVYFLMLPSAPPMIESLNKNAKHKEYFIEKLSNLAAD